MKGDTRDIPLKNIMILFVFIAFVSFSGFLKLNKIEYTLHHLLSVFCFNFLLSLKVNKVLAALQVEVENFILRMAAEFPLRKEQLIFLINNYDMMLAVLMVGSFTTFNFVKRLLVACIYV